MAKTVYLDSCVILDYIRGTQNRTEQLEVAMLQTQEGTGDIAFYSSPLSITEVAYIETEDAPGEVKTQLIDDFWDTAPIEMVEVHRLNSTIARDLLRQRASEHAFLQIPMARKRAADALHLATAIWLQADEFWTWDVKDFQRYPQTTVVVCEPYLLQTIIPEEFLPSEER